MLTKLAGKARLLRYAEFCKVTTYLTPKVGLTVKKRPAIHLTCGVFSQVLAVVCVVFCFVF